MPKVNKFNAEGSQSGQFDLNEAVFASPVREQAVHEALLMQLANRRRALAKCKGVSDVAGGGGKPFRQKGTGRARAGSMRSPLRRGGGVSLGPDGRANYKMTLPRKVRRAALRSILSDAVKDGRLSIVENVQYSEPKTKKAAALVNGFEFADQRILFVIPERDFNFEKSVSNLPKVKALLWSNMNPHDLLHYEQIVLFEGAVDKVVEVLK